MEFYKICETLLQPQKSPSFSKAPGTRQYHYAVSTDSSPLACISCYQCPQRNILADRQFRRFRIPQWFLLPGHFGPHPWTRVCTFLLLMLCNRPQFPHRNYVNAATASSQNLTFSSADHFVVRADFKNVLNPSGPGRNSVRLQSNKRFTTSVSVYVIPPIFSL